MRVSGHVCELVVRECDGDEDASDAYELRVLDESRPLDDEPLVLRSRLAVTPLELAFVTPLAARLAIDERRPFKLSVVASRACACEWYRVLDDSLEETTTTSEISEQMLSDPSRFVKLKTSDERADARFTLSKDECECDDAGLYMARLVDTTRSRNPTQTQPRLQETSALVVVVSLGRVCVKAAPLQASFAPANVKCDEAAPLRLTARLSKKLPAHDDTSQRLRSLFKLSKDNVPIELGTGGEQQRWRAMLSESGAEVSFVLDACALTDAGKYMLSVAGGCEDDDQAPSSCVVKVAAAPAPKKKPAAAKENLIAAPLIVKDLDPLERVECLTSDKCRLTIVAQGAQLADAEWFHDGKPIVPLLDQCQRVQLDKTTTRFVLNFHT